MSRSLTLYSAKICPFAQRVTFALQHLEIPHQLIEIDLQNKPDDYASTVNRASKVPVLKIENTGVAGSKSSAFFPESLIILELLSDLYPYKLMSEDPITRASSRYFVGQLVIFGSLCTFSFPLFSSHRALFPSGHPEFRSLHLPG